MKARVLDYPLFCKHVEQMQASGEKITVRNILARTGGTTSKVAEYLKQWHIHNATQSIGENAVAHEVLQAIILDKQSSISKAVEIYKTQITQLESLTEELSDRCSTQELELDAKDTEIRVINNQYLTKLATADAQLTMFEAQTLEFKQQIKEQNDKLELALAAKYQAEKQVAVLETKLIEFESKLRVN